MASLAILEAGLVAYAANHGLSVRGQLGSGMHGIVFTVEDKLNHYRSAVKIHSERPPYLREVLVYERLSELDVHEVEGFRIPRILRCDDRTQAIEMTIVSPPFALDFGGAYLDETPDFPDDVWEHWRAGLHEKFEENYPIVDRVISAFRMHGIHWLDVHPENLRFS